jgi:uncharacterized membrane protein YkoI
MKRFLIAAAVALPFAVHAADMNCSIKAKKATSKSQQTAMAKVNDDAARKAALDKVAVSGATISKGGLEVEEGCLVYTYDVKVPNKGGAEEVFVDAGTGEVLKVDHESAAKEAAEKAGDKVKSTAKKAKDAVTGDKKPS